MKSILTIKTIQVILLGLLAFLPNVSGAPGDLDASFSQDGKIIERVGTSVLDNSRASALQPDGKIVVVGKVGYGDRIVCGVVRYLPDGSLDYSFDGDGKAFVVTSTSWQCRAVAVQTDGKIVVAGFNGNEYGDPGSSDIIIARLNPDGSLDSSFNGDGQVVTALSEYKDVANAVAIQPDGKIVVAGAAYKIWYQYYVSDFVVVRYNADGSLDTTFDGDGVAKVTYSGYEDIANSLAIQTDGKIVVAGQSFINTLHDFALARFNPDGSLDSTFDGDGKVVTDLGSHSDLAYAVALQADGKIIAAGKTFSDNRNSLALVRYNVDGSLDASFDDDGKLVARADPWDDSCELAVQTDGKIVAVSNLYLDNSGRAGIMAARFNADGSRDMTFDGDGSALATLSDGSAIATSALIQPDGKILVAGTLYAMETDFVLVRFNTDGSLDPAFDGDGKQSNNVGYRPSAAFSVAAQADGKLLALEGASIYRYNDDGTRDSTFDGDGELVLDFAGTGYVRVAALQPDGKIILAGAANQGSSNGFGVYRRNADGSPDTSFDGDGKTVTFFPGGTATVAAILIQPDGKIVATGIHSNNNDPYKIAVARYNPDGSPDTTFHGQGYFLTSLPDGLAGVAKSVVQQADGKIVVAGYVAGGNAFMALRYNPDGSLDNSFDNDGIAIITIPESLAVAESAAIQPDGKIILAGRVAGMYFDFALLRLDPNGALDASFDNDGIVLTDIAGSDFATGVAVLPNGKIVAAGYGATGDYPTSDFAVARYNADGSLDASFGSGGKVKLDVFGETADTAYCMTLDAKGRIVVGGQADGFFTVVRLLNDSAARAPFDFDGDLKTDISIYRPSNGQWWINRSSTAATVAGQFGAGADKIVPGDYTGDGKTDTAVWRPASGEWFILRSEDNSYYSIPFGTSGDVPVPADFDGDGRTDIAVWRPSTSVWYINKSSGGYQFTTFGAIGDQPVVGDYDRDGKSDVAVFRPSNGTWWIIKSGTSTTAVHQFGNGTDKPVQGDYTGDGRTDIAVWRESTGEWFILRSEDGTFYSTRFGAAGDIPAPGDYDGDGRIDTAVFRPSDANWYINRSSAGLLIMNFGLAADRPVPSAFVP